jgi:RNA polymerase-binding transcription factor DksA
MTDDLTAHRRDTVIAMTVSRMALSGEAMSFIDAFEDRRVPSASAFRRCDRSLVSRLKTCVFRIIDADQDDPPEFTLTMIGRGKVWRTRMQKEKFEKILRGRLADLNRRLHLVDSDLGRRKDADDEDRAVELENNDVLEGFGRAGQEEVRAINAALQRLENGTFGICVKCGSPISEARLEAVPFAVTCQSCLSE